MGMFLHRSIFPLTDLIVFAFLFPSQGEPGNPGPPGPAGTHIFISIHHCIMIRMPSNGREEIADYILSPNLRDDVLLSPSCL